LTKIEKMRLLWLTGVIDHFSIRIRDPHLILRIPTAKSSTYTPI